MFDPMQRDRCPPLIASKVFIRIFILLLLPVANVCAQVQAVDPSAPSPRGLDYLPTPLVDRLGGGGGFRVGRFAVQPEVTTGIAYDDNINADENDRVDDFIWIAAASVRAQSQLRRHSVGFDAFAGTGRYFQNESESDVSWGLGADGLLDLTRQSQLSGRVDYTRSRESPESVDGDDGSDNAVFHQINNSANYNHRFTRSGVSVDLVANRIEFEGSDDADRDRWQFRFAPSISYDINPRLTTDLSPSYGRLDYDTREDGTGRDQDEEDYAVEFGASYRVSERASTRVFTGYSWFRPEDNEEDNEQGVIFGAGFDYAVGERTEASLEARRTIREESTLTFTGSLSHALDSRTSLGLSTSRLFSDTDVDGATSRVVTTIEGNVDRRIRSDMELTGSVGASREEFEGIDRQDENIFVRVGYAWAFTDTLSLNLSYRYSQRFSDEDGGDFYRNIAFIGLTARL